MSWEDRIGKLLTITTGEGKTFNVIWLNAQKSIEWHGAEWPFLEVPGQLAKRKKLLGRKFPLEFYFQGADHLDEYAAFETSLNNNAKPCKIDHPIYNVITASIFQMNIDNATMNYTKVTCTALETISDDNPVVVVEPVDAVVQKKSSLDTLSETELTQTPSITDVNSMSNSATQNYNRGLKIITIPEEVMEYTNAFSSAASAINTAIASPLLAIRTTITLITLPAKLTADVKSRISMLVDQFKLLRQTITGLATVPAKQIYQIQGGTIISTMCLTAATPLDGDYRNSTSTLTIVDVLVDNYKQFLEDLDSIQSTNANGPDSYVAGFDAINTLNDIVNLTVASLLQIALSGRQERSLTLTEDTNIVLLTHKLYSLDPSDANMEELIDNNGFTYRDMIGIGKGRKITYYI